MFAQVTITRIPSGLKKLGCSLGQQPSVKQNLNGKSVLCYILGTI
jgi:hypothetical protein